MSRFIFFDSGFPESIGTSELSAPTLLVVALIKIFGGRHVYMWFPLEIKMQRRGFSV